MGKTFLEVPKQDSLFKKAWLERLSRVNYVSIPIILFFLYAGFLLFWATQFTIQHFSQIALLYGLGIFTWTFLEYIMHRNLYHLVPNNIFKERFQYIFHGYHHDFPKDEERLAMPPYLSLLLSSIILGVSYLLIHQYAFAFAAGIQTGYAFYLIIHYSVHVYPAPNFIALKKLWLHHAIHHYQDDNVAYGVTSPFWDYVFGTMPRKKTKQSTIISV
jgi:sterol desaturase/sphingolipid hydroxylase (fatty acid hydroxylase superfamily)